MKKPKVAAEESMYWDIVAMAPLGPGPPLFVSSILLVGDCTDLRTENPPKMNPIVNPTPAGMNQSTACDVSGLGVTYFPS